MQEITELLESFFRFKMMDMWTAVPARVLAVKSTPANIVVDVQPLVTQLYQDGETTEYPVIPDVPVMFPSSTTTVMTFPIVVGDSVLLVFSKANIDNFKASQTVDTVNPSDYRYFNVRDAVAIPGLWPFQAHPALQRIRPVSPLECAITHNVGLPTEVALIFTEAGSIVVSGSVGGIPVFIDLLTHLHTSAAPTVPTSPPIPGS